jgi:hypothetical protein
MSQTFAPRLGSWQLKCVICTLGLTLSAAPIAQVRNNDEGSLVEQGRAAVIQVDSGRPLAKAIELLIAKYNASITYEDAQYEYDDDLSDVASVVRKADQEKSNAELARPILVPRSHPLALSVPVPRNSDDVFAILKRLVAGHDADNQSAGRYQVRRDGDMFHVVPLESRDGEGNRRSNVSVLDAEITVPVETRSAYGTIAAICEAVSQSTSVHVGVGTGISNFGLSNSNHQYSFGVDKQPARSALQIALMLIAPEKGRLTWFLFYGDRRTDNAYAMNFVRVPERGTSEARVVR